MPPRFDVALGVQLPPRFRSGENHLPQLLGVSAEITNVKCNLLDLLLGDERISELEQARAHNQVDFAFLGAAQALVHFPLHSEKTQRSLFLHALLRRTRLSAGDDLKRSGAVCVAVCLFAFRRRGAPDFLSLELLQLQPQVLVLQLQHQLLLLQLVHQRRHVRRHSGTHGVRQHVAELRDRRSVVRLVQLFHHLACKEGDTLEIHARCCGASSSPSIAFNTTNAFSGACNLLEVQQQHQRVLNHGLHRHHGL